jgi:hypothetical protein
MRQVRLSFEGASAIELAEILKGFPGYEVTVTVVEDGLVRAGELAKLQKVAVSFTVAAGLFTTGAGAVKAGAEAVQSGAEAGSAVIEFMQKVKDFQAGSQAIGKIVVIPVEGDRINLETPSGDDLVKAIEGELA